MDKVWFIIEEPNLGGGVLVCDGIADEGRDPAINGLLPTVESRARVGSEYDGVGAVDGGRTFIDYGIDHRPGIRHQWQIGRTLSSPKMLDHTSSFPEVAVSDLLRVPFAPPTRLSKSTLPA